MRFEGDHKRFTFLFLFLGLDGCTTADCNATSHQAASTIQSIRVPIYAAAHERQPATAATADGHDEFTLDREQDVASFSGDARVLQSTDGLWRTSVQQQWSWIVVGQHVEQQLLQQQQHGTLFGKLNISPGFVHISLTLNFSYQQQAPQQQQQQQQNWNQQQQYFR